MSLGRVSGVVLLLFGFAACSVVAQNFTVYEEAIERIFGRSRELALGEAMVRFGADGERPEVQIRFGRDALAPDRWQVSVWHRPAGTASVQSEFYRRSDAGEMPSVEDVLSWAHVQQYQGSIPSGEPLAYLFEQFREQQLPLQFDQTIYLDSVQVLIAIHSGAVRLTATVHAPPAAQETSDPLMLWLLSLRDAVDRFVAAGPSVRRPPDG